LRLHLREATTASRSSQYGDFRRMHIVLGMRLLAACFLLVCAQILRRYTSETRHEGRASGSGRSTPTSEGDRYYHLQCWVGRYRALLDNEREKDEGNCLLD
jgi:hypothetical protein